MTADVAAVSTDPSMIGALLIAGGGGTSGTGGDSNTGGAGGVAIANTNPTGFAVSAAGGHGTSGGAAGGAGGNSSGDGDGGSPDGTAGVGGFSDETGWNDSGSLIPPQSWSAGFGPSGPNDCSRTGGKGGGGFGGGGDGDGNCGGAGAGGGGGSWAAANTAYDASAPTAAPTPPAGSAGAIELVYSLPASWPEPCTVTSSSVTCSLPSGSSTADLEDAISAAAFAASVASLSVTINDSTPMWIRAWGGEGGSMPAPSPAAARGWRRP